MASPHRNYSPQRRNDNTIRTVSASRQPRSQSEDRYRSRNPRSTSQNNSSQRERYDPPQSPGQTATSFLAYPVSRVATSLYRRLTEDMNGHRRQASLSSIPSNIQTSGGGPIYVPRRTASPFAPPPLTGLTLRGHRSPKQQILSRALAEEIRLLLPPRLQLAADWTLAYSVETDGVSLGTLYEKCSAYSGGGHGFVLVVKDGLGGIFGAYLTDPPQPSPHYFGTGECFLWRATILPAASWMSNLPPPPSADTSNLQRSTTILAHATTKQIDRDMLSPWGSSTPEEARPKSPQSPESTTNGTSEDLSDRIRFKAFPYSGVNDYMMFCEQNYLSIGGGDGRYGLWLDSVLEHGITSTCLTFGNEPLSEEGEKFDVLGVEIWWVDS